jgi:hypothetical protein
MAAKRGRRIRFAPVSLGDERQTRELRIRSDHQGKTINRKSNAIITGLPIGGIRRVVTTTALVRTQNGILKGGTEDAIMIGMAGPGIVPDPITVIKMNGVGVAAAIDEAALRNCLLGVV